MKLLKENPIAFTDGDKTTVGSDVAASDRHLARIFSRKSLE